MEPIELSRRLGRAHRALVLIAAQPRDQPLHLSIRQARNLLPTDIVHLCLVLELVQRLGFPSVQLDAPEPNFLGVYLWRIGLWDLFPAFAPRRPQHPLPRGSTDRCIELTRFTDLAGAVFLGERLPGVLFAAPDAEAVPGGPRTLRRLANTVFELTENTVAHSARLSRADPVVGYYMVQRMPKRRQTFIAVGDLGDGIPATMRARYSDLPDDLSALRYALEPGVSGSDGGGNGLHVAQQAVQVVPGSVMSIESGGAFLRIRASGPEEAEQYPVPLGLTRVSFLFKL